jgi:hypothetical protein
LKKTAKSELTATTDKHWSKAMDTFADMTIPDYVAFGVLIVLFVVNVLAVFAGRDSAASPRIQ